MGQISSQLGIGKKSSKTKKLTKKSSNKLTKKSSKKTKIQKAGSLANTNTHEDKIVQLYTQDIDLNSSDNDKVGYLDDDYDDIINLNDF